jgi:hypothetical protein
MEIIDVVKIEEREDPGGRKWYVTDPAEFYPFAVGALLEALDGKWSAPKDCAQYLDVARMHGKDPYALALTPRDNFKSDTLQERMIVALRSQALENARLFATALLKARTPEPMGLHILKGDGNFRL